jgi:uncharacterized protein YdeI (YjbR/CyaY-like superfamily)
MKIFDPKSEEDWHSWLEKNHLSESEIWLVYHKKGSSMQTGISYDESLDWALCYGWIDSLIKRIDDERYARKFTPRKPTSIWSKSNIERMNRLIREPRMTERGVELFRKRSKEVSLAERFNAKQIPFPASFTVALKKNERAWQNFRAFSPSHRKQYQMWIASAKRDETRDRRIEEAIRLISKNVKSLTK